MDKKSLFAFLLITVVWIVWLEYYAPKKVSKPAVKKPQLAEQKELKKEALAAKKEAEQPAKIVKTKKVSNLQLDSPTSAKYLQLENKLFKMVFSSWGGAIIDLELKNYKKSQEKKSKNIELIDLAGEADYFPHWQFELAQQKINDAGLYKVESFDKDKGEVIFSRQLSAGLTIRKTYLISNSSYLSKCKLELIATSEGKKTVKAIANLPFSYSTAKKKSRRAMGVGKNQTRMVSLVNGKIIRRKFGKKKALEPLTDINHLAWAGVDTLYFIKAFIPKVSLPDQLQIIPLGQQDKLLKKFKISLSFLQKEITAKEAGSFDFNLYLGPKDIDRLEMAGVSLERAIDLGSWLGWIARPLLSFMKWINRFVHNFGLAIIILTLLVRLAMNPLNKAQYRQMKKMQELQPELKKLKEQFKEDKVKQQQETMALFRRNKVNPMGGCFPMLLQMPIFFALYRVLYNSIELRHAPFFLWIKDLSAPDPFFITPVLMGLAMYFQQKLTPMTGDQTQQAVMKFTPIIFTIFMLWLPSGLVLYILTSTMLGVIQQRQMLRAK